MLGNYPSKRGVVWKIVYEIHHLVYANFLIFDIFCITLRATSGLLETKLQRGFSEYKNKVSSAALAKNNFLLP